MLVSELCLSAVLTGDRQAPERAGQAPEDPRTAKGPQAGGSTQQGVTMIDGMPVIDAVVHGFDWNPYNMNMEPGKLWGSSLAVTYRRSPRYASYMLEAERAEKKHTAEEMLSTMFAESQTDVVVYHVVRRIG